jgi:hypothetical protein
VYEARLVTAHVQRDDFRKQKHLITEEVRRFLDGDHVSDSSLASVGVLTVV